LHIANHDAKLIINFICAISEALKNRIVILQNIEIVTPTEMDGQLKKVTLFTFAEIRRIPVKGIGFVNGISTTSSQCPLSVQTTDDIIIYLYKLGCDRYTLVSGVMKDI